MQTLVNLSDILKESAEKFFLNIAVEDLKGNQITYNELYQNSNYLADLLLKNGIGLGDRIGVLLPKSIEAVQAIFSILKSKASYVPLDFSTPILRTVSICKDCSLQAIFIEKKIIPDFLSIEQQSIYSEISLNDTISILVFKEKKQKHTQNLAYIIYTSGSTGVPKGVMHTHNSAFAFVKWGVDTFAPNSSDNFFSYAPFHFDLSIFDLFVSISVGATLILSNEKIMSNPMQFAQCLSEKNISILYATPSVLSLLTTFGKMEKYNYSDLRIILFAGEVFPITPLKKLKNYLLHTQFYNLYGPTETNVCTWFKIPDIINEEIKNPFPIGKPCNYAQYKIDVNNELLIAGNSLMCGYWNDDEKTNLAFKIDNNHIKWYRTGDIVELNEANDLVYLHRNDRMVKRNGYRIELNEIEKTISLIDNLVEVAVTSASNNNQTNITAHIVWIEKNKTSTIELINFCNTILPSYMIPDNFKFYDQLPKTSTHKIDYKQLQNL